MSRYVLVSPDQTYVHRLAAAATGQLAGEIREWNAAVLPRGAAELFARHPADQLPEVVVVGPGVPADHALALASDIDRWHPDVSVLLVHSGPADVAVAAMRAGIRDVLDPEADQVDINALLHRAVQSSANRRQAFTPLPPASDASPKGRVIAVISPKGGAGKTTIATNLAVGLAASAPHETVLVDLDLQFGDVANALQIAPEQSLAEAVRGAAPQDTMVLKSYLSPHPSGLYALCAPDSPADEAHISAADITHLLEQLAGQYRYVVIDTGAGLSDHTLAALDSATDFIFVAGMDVPSIRGLRKELDVLKALGMVPAATHVVLNGADPRDGLSLHNVETTLGRKTDVVIPFSRAVRLSTNQGTPLLQGSKKDKASKELRRLVNRFTPGPVPAPKRQSKARHRRGTL
ncbi:AAA family ATPase [Paenarthrobacter sp. Z7-10]|uniref:AAA family ATPase n=1 Tax=Paenarthrobacter sp. Z7-10 TaxID=2787635 RepID=UPI0022A9DDCB|nr:AAA family ATPase [Paenarthrobacter sp. Z7-10]MCZ2402569.1 AAA family ATPase [Paenarthrobacter sp. Z7-10]